MTMKIAFVFPGQGSQAVGMLDAWSGVAAVTDSVARASAALGQDLAALIAQGPVEQLNLTTNTSRHADRGRGVLTPGWPQATASPMWWPVIAWASMPR